MLGDLDHRTPVDAVTIERLTRWKQLEFLRIAARDLDGTRRPGGGGPEPGRPGHRRDRGGRAGSAGTNGLAVIGMGKLGGGSSTTRATSTSSSWATVAPGELEAAARQVMDLARHCFRVDVDLRPEGRDGPLVRTLDSYEAYWDRWAETWEFQALLKARAGGRRPRRWGWRFHEAAAARLWSRPFGADELRSLRAMKARAEETGHPTGPRRARDRSGDRAASATSSSPSSCSSWSTAAPTPTSARPPPCWPCRS